MEVSDRGRPSEVYVPCRAYIKGALSLGEKDFIFVELRSGRFRSVHIREHELRPLKELLCVIFVMREHDCHSVSHHTLEEKPSHDYCRDSALSILENGRSVEIWLDNIVVDVFLNSVQPKRDEVPLFVIDVEELFHKESPIRGFVSNLRIYHIF